MTNINVNPDIRVHVRDRYSKIAEDFQVDVQADCGCGSSDSSCCGSSDTLSTEQIDTVAKMYEAPDANDLPDEVTGLSLGCGDPITLAALQPGQTVLDLGSGGGIDCFLAGKRVGPTGRVIGVDMTPAMIERARANKEKLGADNVEFRFGEIEHLPVADRTVDVIISNCVINLSPDKPQVFREAFRALRPGGKLAVSDIVTDGPLPAVVKNSLSAWAGCVAGALEVKDYIGGMEAAGFTNIEITPVYLDKNSVQEALDTLGDDVDVSEFSPEVVHKTVFSAKITAWKPL